MESNAILTPRQHRLAVLAAIAAVATLAAGVAAHAPSVEGDLIWLTPYDTTSREARS